MNADLIKQQIRNLLVSYPELADDDALREDMIEGETDAFEFLSMLARQIGENEAQADGLDNYIKTLKARKDRFDRRDEALREMIMKVMQAADIKKAPLPEATLSIRVLDAKVIIADDALIPRDFCTEKTTYTPDKARIKEELCKVDAATGAAITVPGAVLSNGGESLSVRFK